VTQADIDEIVAHARQRFEEGLLKAGFSERDGMWHGQVPRGSNGVEVRLGLPSTFPFAPPRVYPVPDDAAPWSWHRERDGALCIVAEDDHDDLWWADAPTILEQAAAWFAGADVGWANDRPDLDLDRYFGAASEDSIYIYEGFDGLRNSNVRFEPDKNDTMLLRVGQAATTRKRKPTGRGKPEKIPNRTRFGYIADVGSVAAPPRSWDDIVALAKLSDDTIRRIKGGSISVLGLIYDRGGHEGLVLLEVRSDASGTISATRLLSASNTPDARRARSGPGSQHLSDKRVAIVGVGALGSFIADALVRSGVGSLTLVDHDLLLPGNLVRHHASQSFVGLPKTTAVKCELVAAGLIDPASVRTSSIEVRDTTESLKLLGAHELVINATADFAVTAALHKAAEAIGAHILSVALQNSGETIRVDVLPPLADAELLPNSTRPRDPSVPEVFEPGCGSPISPTAPYAVMEAAGIAARHAVAMLLGRPIHPAGEIRHIFPDTRGEDADVG